MLMWTWLVGTMDYGATTRIAIEVEEVAMTHFEEDMVMEEMDDVAHI